MRQFTSKRCRTVDSTPRAAESTGQTVDSTGQAATILSHADNNSCPIAGTS